MDSWDNESNYSDTDAHVSKPTEIHHHHYPPVPARYPQTYYKPPPHKEDSDIKTKKHVRYMDDDRRYDYINPAGTTLFDPQASSVMSRYGVSRTLRLLFMHVRTINSLFT